MMAKCKILLTELAEKADPLANLSSLKTGKAKAILFSSLEAVGQPGEILGYKGEGG